VVQLRAILHRLRHQRQQPAELSRQRTLAALFPEGGLSARGEAPGAKRAGADAGGETGEILADGADPAEEQPEDVCGEPAQDVLRRDRSAQPLQDGGEVVGWGAGLGFGHGALLV